MSKGYRGMGGLLSDGSRGGDAKGGMPGLFRANFLVVKYKITLK